MLSFIETTLGKSISITYPRFLKNKHTGLTGLKLHKHGFENLPSTLSWLLDAADLFKTLPYLKLNDKGSNVDHGLNGNPTFECKWLLEHSCCLSGGGYKTIQMKKNQYPLSCFPWESVCTLKTPRALQETIPVVECKQTRQGFVLQLFYSCSK